MWPLVLSLRNQVTSRKTYDVWADPQTENTRLVEGPSNVRKHGLVLQKMSHQMFADVCMILVHENVTKRGVQKTFRLSVIQLWDCIVWCEIRLETSIAFQMVES